MRTQTQQMFEWPHNRCVGHTAYIIPRTFGKCFERVAKVVTFTDDTLTLATNFQKNRKFSVYNRHSIFLTKKLGIYVCIYAWYIYVCGIPQTQIFPKTMKLIHKCESHYCLVSILRSDELLAAKNM